MASTNPNTAQAITNNVSHPNQIQAPIAVIERSVEQIEAGSSSTEEQFITIVLDPPKKESLKEIVAITRFQKIEKLTGLGLLYILKAFGFVDANKVCVWVSTAGIVLLSITNMVIFKQLLERISIVIMAILIISMTIFKFKSFQKVNYKRNQMAFTYMFLFEFSYFFAYCSLSYTKKAKPYLIGSFDMRIASYVAVGIGFIPNGCVYILAALAYAVSLMLIPFFGIKRFYRARVYTEIFDALYPRKSKQITIRIKGIYITNARGESSCPLCLEPVNNSADKIVQGNCHETHLFHLECLKYMLIYNKLCPFCRKPLTDDNVDFSAH